MKAESETRIYLRDTGCVTAQDLLNRVKERFPISLIKPYAFDDEYFHIDMNQDGGNDIVHSVRIRTWYLNDTKPPEKLIEAVKSDTISTEVDGMLFKKGSEKESFANGRSDEYDAVLETVKSKGYEDPLFTIIKKNGVHYAVSTKDSIVPDSEHKRRIAIEDVYYKLPGSDEEIHFGVMAEVEVSGDDEQKISASMKEIIDVMGVESANIINIPMGYIIYKELNS